MSKAKPNRKHPRDRQKLGRVRIFRCGMLLSGALVPLLGVALLISGCASKPVSAVMGSDGVQTIKVTVQHGYSPSYIQAKAGAPLKIEFYRDEDPGAASCGKDLVVPSENVNIPLPARESQIVEIKPQAAGSEVEFQCGMHMMKGHISFK